MECQKLEKQVFKKVWSEGRSIFINIIIIWVFYVNFDLSKVLTLKSMKPNEVWWSFYKVLKVLTAR